MNRISGSGLFTRRHFFIGGALAAAAGVAVARQPQPQSPRVPKDKFAKWVPERVGDWSKVGSSGVVLPPPDALSDRLYDNLVTGTYDSPTRPFVMMLIAYNNKQDGVVQLHRPEVCYPTGGYELTETRDIVLGDGDGAIPAKFFTAAGPDRVEQIAYFTRLGSTFPRNWMDQRLAVARENLAGNIPDGLLVRFSMLGQDPAEAVEVLGAFAEQFVRAAALPLRQLLFASGKSI